MDAGRQVDRATLGRVGVVAVGQEEVDGLLDAGRVVVDAVAADGDAVVADEFLHVDADRGRDSPKGWRARKGRVGVAAGGEVVRRRTALPASDGERRLVGVAG